jgi:hypothetical protein
MRYCALAFAASIAVMLVTGATAVQPGTSHIKITSRVVEEGAGLRIKLTLRNEALSDFSIGSGILLCTRIGGGPFVSQAKRCNGTYRLANGTIEVTGVISSRSFYSLAVVGGTGLYANAGAGEMTAVTINLNPRRERLNFTLYAP